jgi:hypothetical protein
MHNSFEKNKSWRFCGIHPAQLSLCNGHSINDGSTLVAVLKENNYTGWNQCSSSVKNEIIIVMASSGYYHIYFLRHVVLTALFMTQAFLDAMWRQLLKLLVFWWTVMTQTQVSSNPACLLTSTKSLTLQKTITFIYISLAVEGYTNSSAANLCEYLLILSLFSDAFNR